MPLLVRRDLADDARHRAGAQRRKEGLNLLLSSYRFNKPMSEVTRATLPMLLVLLVGVLLITYVPPLTTLLPHLFK